MIGVADHVGRREKRRGRHERLLQMVVANGWPEDADGQQSRSGVNVTTVNSLLDELRRELFSGEPPVEFPVANEPWGSFAFRPGDIVAIAAPPAMGKTALITQMTVDALRLSASASCLFCNVEMSPKTILERQISRLSGVMYEQIARRAILLGEHREIDRAFETLGSIGDRMAFMGQPFSIEHVIEAVAEKQPKILVLDYLQRITCCDGVADNRVRLNNVMHAARAIASAGVCVVLISAVGRTQSKKGGGYNANELGMGSFRESSEVEYGADDAFVMVEEGPTDDATGYKTVIMKHVKSRNHRQRDIRLEFDGAIQRFRLLPDRRESETDAGRGYHEVVSPEEVRRAARPQLALPEPLHLDVFFLDPDEGEGESQG